MRIGRWLSKLVSGVRVAAVAPGPLHAPVAGAAEPRRFTVIVRDNFHYMDDEDSVEDGSFVDYEAAVARCRSIVDASLAHEYKEGMTGDELYEAYTSFGDDPAVAPSPGEERFSAWSYAKRRCIEICGSGPSA